LTSPQLGQQDLAEAGQGGIEVGFLSSPSLPKHAQEFEVFYSVFLERRSVFGGSFVVRILEHFVFLILILIRIAITELW
jgi:hypothetical protein